ncbi:MAG: DUF4340 domain-containing protein [Flammeovirgaceae bacterium]
MFKKLSNTTLIGVFVLLAAVYFGIDFFGGGSAGKSASLRDTLVEIDTAIVSRILINKAGVETELVKAGEDWKVKLGNGKMAEAMTGKVMSSLEMLFQAKPSRLVSKNEQKWKEYQVDSAGTQIQVYEGDKKTLDLVLGRFGTKQLPGGQPQQFNRNNIQFFSYVRLSDEKEVYACDDFMGMSFSANAADYRDNSLLNFNNPDSITAIRFNYPADSSFVLNNIAGDWQINSTPTDSTHTATLLSAVKNAKSNNFVDDVELSLLGTPTMTITYESKELPQPMVLKAFQHPSYQWILHSSHNPEALFADASVKEKLFISSSQLLPNQ